MDEEIETRSWDAPFVCPGCYAINGEPCAADCVDAEIERDRLDAYEHGPGYYDRYAGGLDEEDING